MREMIGSSIARSWRCGRSFSFGLPCSITLPRFFTLHLCVRQRLMLDVVLQNWAYVAKNRLAV